MAVMRAGDAWAAAVEAEVGAVLRAQGAHYGASRVEADGTRAVSWYFAPRGRRERVLVLRRHPDARCEVVLADRTASEPDGRVRERAATSVRTDRAGLGTAVREVLATGPTTRPVPARPARERVDLGSPLLGVLLGVALVVGARTEITFAPELLALALPLLGVSLCRLVARVLRATVG